MVSIFLTFNIDSPVSSLQSVLGRHQRLFLLKTSRSIFHALDSRDKIKQRSQKTSKYYNQSLLIRLSIETGTAKRMMMICFSDTFEIKKDLKETNEIRRLAAGIDYTMLMLVISGGGISCLVSSMGFLQPHQHYTLSIIDYILQIEHRKLTEMTKLRPDHSKLFDLAILHTQNKPL